MDVGRPGSPALSLRYVVTLHPLPMAATIGNKQETLVDMGRRLGDSWEFEVRSWETFGGRGETVGGHGETVRSSAGS